MGKMHKLLTKKMSIMYKLHKSVCGADHRPPKEERSEILLFTSLLDYLVIIVITSPVSRLVVVAIASHTKMALAILQAHFSADRRV